MELQKEIKLIHNGKQASVPVIPFISGKKKKELEAINIKYLRKVDDLLTQKEIGSTDITDEYISNKISLFSEEIANMDLKSDVNPQQMQLKIAKIGLNLFNDESNIDYIKCIIDVDKIKNKEIIDAINTDYNSEFWFEQDVIYLAGIADSFRRIIRNNK